MPNLPLSGVRVLDLSRLLPGPFCSMLLAELGAEVIKIEDPNGGDYLRWFPPLIGHSGSQFIAVNRGKKSVALSLKPKEGKEILHKLISSADVVLESFRPGVMQRLGFGLEDLLKQHPRLVCCAISGYGQDGPMSDRAGHDIDYLAIGGVFSLMGVPPRVLPIQVADIAGGALYAALGITAALFGRERTGQGRVLDISMTEGSLSFMTIAMAQAWGEQRPLTPGGELLNGGLSGYNLYQTADGGHLAVGALEPKFWKEFVDAIGLPQIEDNGLSVGDEATKQAVSARIKEKTRAEWEALFASRDACVEPVLALSELASHPQHKARNAIVDTPEGPIIRSPIHRLHNEPPKPAPALGENTHEILVSLGYSASELRGLEEQSVIQQWKPE
jgi:alpha-methylacyl-CoA racemase